MTMKEEREDEIRRVKSEAMAIQEDQDEDIWSTI
jgi:hypothetical protein